MGFRTGAYAKVWEVSGMSDACTKVRLSVNRKNKQTEQYEQEFSGYVLAVGTAAAAKALRLEKGDCIKLGDVDVTTKYDRETKREFVSYKMFSFEDASGGGTSTPAPDGGAPAEYSEDEHELPF